METRRAPAVYESIYSLPHVARSRARTPASGVRRPNSGRGKKRPCPNKGQAQRQASTKALPRVDGKVAPAASSLASPPAAAVSLIKRMMVRETFVERLERVVLKGMDAATQALAHGSGPFVETLLKLLSTLRKLSVGIIEDAEAGDEERGGKPLMWGELNYLTKMATDTWFLNELPGLEQLLGVSLESNPLVCHVHLNGSSALLEEVCYGRVHEGALGLAPQRCEAAVAALMRHVRATTGTTTGIWTGGSTQEGAGNGSALDYMGQSKFQYGQNLTPAPEAGALAGAAGIAAPAPAPVAQPSPFEKVHNLCDGLLSTLQAGGLSGAGASDAAGQIQQEPAQVESDWVDNLVDYSYDSYQQVQQGTTQEQQEQLELQQSGCRGYEEGIWQEQEQEQGSAVDFTQEEPHGHNIGSSLDEDCGQGSKGLYGQADGVGHNEPVAEALWESWDGEGLGGDDYTYGRDGDGIGDGGYNYGTVQGEVGDSGDMRYGQEEEAGNGAGWALWDGVITTAMSKQPAQDPATGFIGLALDDAAWFLAHQAFRAWCDVTTQEPLQRESQASKRRLRVLRKMGMKRWKGHMERKARWRTAKGFAGHYGLFNEALMHGALQRWREQVQTLKNIRRGSRILKRWCHRWRKNRRAAMRHRFKQWGLAVRVYDAATLSAMVSLLERSLLRVAMKHWRLQKAIGSPKASSMMKLWRERAKVLNTAKDKAPGDAMKQSGEAKHKTAGQALKRSPSPLSVHEPETKKGLNFPSPSKLLNLKGFFTRHGGMASTVVAALSAKGHHKNMTCDAAATIIQCRVRDYLLRVRNEREANLLQTLPEAAAASVLTIQQWWRERALRCASAQKLVRAWQHRTSACQKVLDQLVYSTLNRSYESSEGDAPTHPNVAIPFLFRAKPRSIQADTNYRANGTSVLHLCCRYGHLAAAEHLIKIGCYLETRLLILSGAELSAEPTRSVLLVAIAAPVEELKVHKTVSALLWFGVSPHAVNGMGCSAVHEAAARGATTVLELLVEAGAAVNAVNAQGLTPLMYALVNGSRPGAKVLLRMGADSSIQDASGTAALALAVELGDLTSIDMLAHLQASSMTGSVDAKDSSGATALHLACERSNSGAVALLVRYGAAVDEPNGAGLLPAQLTEDAKCLELLERAAHKPLPNS